VAEDLDLIGGQPGTRQHGFQSGLLPSQQALGLQDAFRCLHPQAREFTHTVTNNASSARIDRWLVNDSLLPNVSAASVTDLILSDHYGVAVTVSPANAPPPRPWALVNASCHHFPPCLQTLMTAQIQTFLHANPVTTTLSRAARWDQLKVHIQDAARGYCFTFHAQRAGQLRVLRVRASKARAAYVAAPGSQHALDELRRTAAALLQHRSRRAKVQSRASHLMSCKQLSSCLLGARSQIAQASQPAQPSDTSDSDAILASSPSSQQVSLSSSSTSRHGHLARQLALKTVKAMIHNDWTKCNDKIKQISGVCSNWLRGKDPSMTLAAFKSLWCHSGILASVTSPSGDVDGWLEPGCQPILVLCD